MATPGYSKEKTATPQRLVLWSQVEEHFQIARTVDDCDDRNGPNFPCIRNHPRMEVPEPIPPVQQFFVIMSDTRISGHTVEPLEEFIPQPIRYVGIVLRNLTEDLFQILPGLRGKAKFSPAWWTSCGRSHFLFPVAGGTEELPPETLAARRRRSAIISRSSS